MFKWLRNFFKRPVDGSAGAPQLPGTNSMWIPAAENEFGIDILDCSAFCQSMISSSDDLRIAATFAQLRSSLGEKYRDKTPANAKSADCDLTYPYDGQHSNGALFKAQEMEDKWDIYHYDSKIYFARSWTGDLIFVADVVFTPDCVRLISVTADAVRAVDSAYAIASVDYLMKSHIYRRLIPHPLPQDHTNDPYQIACFSFGQYGRFAGFASFEDTTQIKIPVRRPNSEGDA